MIRFLSLVLLILILNSAYAAGFEQDNLAWGWHKKKKIKQEKISEKDLQTELETSQNEEINTEEEGTVQQNTEQVTAEESDSDTSQEAEQEVKSKNTDETASGENQEENSEETVKEPVREDTETVFESPIEEDYKVKHELIKYYKAEYDKDFNNVEVILKLANLYFDIGQRADAKVYLMQLYNTYPNNPAIQFEMGKFYYKCKQYNTALEFFKLALSSGYLKNPEVNEYTLKTYRKLGDEENAQLYEQILEHISSPK